MRGVCFFFNDTATTEIYTLSLHDALPISLGAEQAENLDGVRVGAAEPVRHARVELGRLARGEHQLVRDRKSTRLNSSHANISYAVFCLKKKHTHMHSIMYAPKLLCSRAAI